MPRRARYLVPRGLPRRDEILAACVVLVVLAHVLFAQLTIILAAVFYLITKMTRWRLSWLAVPAAAGLAWTVAAGPRAAAAGFAAGPAQIADYLGASGHQADHLLHFTAAFTGIGTWLPRQLPLAVVAGAAEAALAGWLSWLHTDEWNLPPGPARPDRRGPARGDGPRDPRGRRGDQGRRLPRSGARVRRPGHAVVGRGGRGHIRVRFGRAGRAGHQLPADPRRGPAAQAGTRRRPHVRSGTDRQGWPRSAPRLARRCWCSVPRRGSGPEPRPDRPTWPATSRSGTAIPGGGPRWSRPCSAGTDQVGSTGAAASPTSRTSSNCSTPRPATRASRCSMTSSTCLTRWRCGPGWSTCPRSTPGVTCWPSERGYR